MTGTSAARQPAQASEPDRRARRQGRTRPQSPDEDGAAAGGADQSPESGGDAPPARALEPGLYLLATPIGAARDITLRALDILAGADVLAAEDTRSLRRLMDIHGIALQGRPLLAYHDHNGARMRPRLLAALAEGRAVAYASEAGTPLVADPGYRLVQEAVAAGHRVSTAPGASAVLAAMTVAGLPSDRFCFLGFPPAQKAARRRFLAEIAAIPATLVLYESPKRIRELLGELVQALDGDRAAALCRELTKRHEEVIRGSLTELAEAVSGREMRGEIVLVLDRARDVAGDADAVAAALSEAMASMSLREAAEMVARAQGIPRRRAYQMALELRGGDKD